jgi:hypothetical protein
MRFASRGDVTPVTAPPASIFHNEIVLMDVAVEDRRHRLSPFAFRLSPEKPGKSEARKAKSENRNS